MPTPLSELLPQIVSLNVPEQPFSFFGQGNQIIGWWDIAKATTLYATEVEHIDKSYRLTVTLDEQSGTYYYQDVSTEIEARARFTEDGFTIGGQKSWSSGKSIKKEIHFSFGGFGSRSTGGDATEVGFQPVAYTFETSRIKDPLFTWLDSHGWCHKSVLGKFFAR